MEKLLDGARILVTGGTGFLGKYVMAALAQQGAKAIPLSKGLGYDLRNETEVLQAFLIERPDIVVHLAATVGGIGANMANPATFIKDNLSMGMNVVHASALSGSKLINVGTVCFPGETLVRLADDSYKPIKAIVPGDLVVTHEGRSRKVTSVHKRAWDSSLIEVRPLGAGKILCTPEHPFLTKRGWIQARDLRKDDLLKHVATKRPSELSVNLLPDSSDRERYEEYKAIYKNPEALDKIIKTKEYAGSLAGKRRYCWARGLSSPRLLRDLPSSEVSVAGDLAWFSGMYTAEGFCGLGRKSDRTETPGGRNYIGVTPGYNLDHTKQATKAFRNIWGIKPKIRATRSSYKMEIGHRIACGFLSKYFYNDPVKEAHTKVVPEFILSANAEARCDYVRGYWEGDGHFRKRLRNESETWEASCTTVSKPLCFQLRDLLLGLGVWAGVSRLKGLGETVIEGRRCKTKETWSIHVCGSSAQDMKKLLSGKKYRDHGDWDVPIHSIVETEKTNIEVYNLSVEEDESYLVNGIAVHNCSYPKHCPTPFREEDFWNGYPEETNAPYGIAKKTIGVMCEAYRKQYGLQYGYLIPANLYGMGDHFEEKVSHVIPAMIKRFVDAVEAEAPEVTCWGTGKATRSFLFAPDAAKAIAIACAELDSDKIVNLPGSEEITMKKLAETVAKILKYKGRLNWDATRPDGQPKRLVDGTRARQMLGWAPETALQDGLEQTIEWYLELRRKAAALV